MEGTKTDQLWRVFLSAQMMRRVITSYCEMPIYYHISSVYDPLFSKQRNRLLRPIPQPFALLESQSMGELRSDQVCFKEYIGAQQIRKCSELSLLRLPSGT